MLSPSENKPLLTNIDITELKPKDKNKFKRVIKVGKRTLSINVDALDTLFYVMTERHRIYRKRNAGIPPPWTDDPVLAENRFCNVFRVLDRGTQYVIEEVINKGPQTHTETCFRVMLYKLFNRITTWEYLVQKLGTPTWETFNLNRYGEVLRRRLLTAPIYTAAYQIPAPNLGRSSSHLNHLYLLQMMMEDDVPGLLLQKNNLQDGYELIAGYPGMGPFLSLQLLLDLNMTLELNFSEREWVTCGPGSRSYLRTIFGSSVGGVESEAIAYLYNTQDEHFDRLGIFDPPSLSPDSPPPGVSHVDLEHALCECHKYVRMKKQLAGGHKSKKTRFKTEVKREMKVEMKEEMKEETKTEVKEETKTEVKEETKTEVKKETKTKVKKEMKMEVRAEMIGVKHEMKAGVKAKSKFEKTKDEMKIEAQEEVRISKRRKIEIVIASNPPLRKMGNIIEVIELTNTDDEDDPDIIDLCEDSDSETDYEVSHIINDRRKRDGSWEYRVRWVGYGSKDDTWLPEKELSNAPLVLREWRAIRRTGRPERAGIHS